MVYVVQLYQMPIGQMAFDHCKQTKWLPVSSLPNLIVISNSKKKKTRRKFPSYSECYCKLTKLPIISDFFQFHK